MAAAVFSLEFPNNKTIEQYFMAVADQISSLVSKKQPFKERTKCIMSWQNQEGQELRKGGCRAERGPGILVLLITAMAQG